MKIQYNTGLVETTCAPAMNQQLPVNTCTMDYYNISMVETTATIHEDLVQHWFSRNYCYPVMIQQFPVNKIQKIQNNIAMVTTI